jgi:hypothetical protein
MGYRALVIDPHLIVVDRPAKRNVPQWWPIACFAPQSRKASTASAGFRCCVFVNQRGS